VFNALSHFEICHGADRKRVGDAALYEV
jgi:hypothetical protein